MAYIGLLLCLNYLIVRKDKAVTPKYLGTYSTEDERNNPTIPPFPPPTTSHNQISCLSVPSHPGSVRAALRWSAHSSLEANSDAYEVHRTVLGDLT